MPKRDLSRDETPRLGRSDPDIRDGEWVRRREVLLGRVLVGWLETVETVWQRVYAWQPSDVYTGRLSPGATFHTMAEGLRKLAELQEAGDEPFTVASTGLGWRRA